MGSDFFRVNINSSLKELADKFSNNYYLLIEKLSLNIQKYTQYIPEVIDLEIVAFKKRAREAGHKLQEYITLRKQMLLPYLYELHEKKSSGHNCNNCSGNCSVEHKLKLTELTSSIKSIKTIAVSITEDIHKMSVIKNDITIKVLCNELQLINNLITELILLEEEVLLPKIVETQKEINAY